MADICKTFRNSALNKPNDDCEDMNMILTIVIKRRKAIPAKCMEINKQIFAYELQRMESANLDIEENQEKEKFRKIIQGFKRLKFFQLSLDDLHDAEKKLQNYYKKTKEINIYLQKRKNFKVAVINTDN